MMADILGGVLEVAANIAITALATAAVVAATGITVVTGGLGCIVLGLVVGTIVGLAMSKTGADKGLSNWCEKISNALFPPTVQANILTGSTNTLTNNIPAARAAGAIPSHVAPAGTELEIPEPEAEASYLDMAESFFSQMWRPTVATPAPGAVPKPLDLLVCMKHPPMPPQFMAEGSDKVTINGQPAVRSGDRSTCDAKVVSSGLISSNVTIGGGSVVVREIRSGKTPGVGLAVTALLMLKGGKGKFFSKLPCMLVGGATSMAVSSAMGAMANAAMGSSNPVHAATGAKVLGGDEELDFVLPGVLPIDWQRFYNSRDERRDGLFGAGWSVSYEVCVEILSHPEGGETLVYTDEQGRRIDMGSIPLGGAVFSAGEGLSVRRHVNGQLLIESDDGLYRLFDVTPGNPSLLRLNQLGDRNDNRIYLDYDDAGGLARLRDTFDLVQVELIRERDRVTHIERLYPDQRREALVSYGYDAAGNLAEVRDATGQVQRRFAYDAGRRMVEHQLPTGLRCFYEWALIEDLEWRVVRHWTDEGDAYQFDYDLGAGVTRITDGLQRVSTRRWNSQHQITEYTDNLGQTWQFEWNDERQLLSATDPQGGRYEYSYDDAGNLIGETDPLGRSDSTLWLELWALPLVDTDAAGNSWQYRYDQRGNCIVETDPLGHIVHRLERDAVGRLIAKLTDDGRTDYTYDPLDQLTAVTFTDHHGNAQTLSFAYDALGQLLEEQSAAGSLHYHYDELGNLIQTQLPDGRWLNRLYYGSGHLHQINLDGQVISDFERDRLHREVLRTQGQISTRSEYDRSGRLRSRQRRHSSQPSLMPAAVQKHFEYDPADNLIGKLDQQPAAQHRQLLHYDATGRIIASQDSLHGQRETFAYDAAANLLDGPQPGAGLVVHNKLLTYQDKRYRYDAFGRMIEKRSAKRGLQRFAYDAESRLIEVRNENGSVLRMTYDPLGRRIKKTEHDTNGYPLGETRFTWDGLRLLQEHRHQQTSLYLYEDEGYEPLARVDGTGPLQKIRYYHNDLNGLPEQLTETDGHNVWQATYRVWGNTLEEVREPYYIEEQNLRFQGQYLDRETGLHFNTFRFYDPDVGRFTTPDPIGLAGGFNLYAFVLNPFTWLDPLGLAGCTLTKARSKQYDYKLRLKRSEYPQTFGHIDGAIKKGHPYIVTIQRDTAKLNRKLSLKDIKTKTGKDRDEWPMAMFKEGGNGASVKYIDPSDNRGAGSSIGNALSDLPNGTRVKIEVY
ncbi:RHS repeat-associated core domain-containing protein [Pseudomonas sp. JV414]|uniref:RHS repeat-associated core domain-containing protein n=1 Tax=Pseudomonas sp. JV414 TaxID=1733110 RepID=UPI0028F41FC2|nr:RHS repeat-associated core domain-containing protein [Pseudomonas sp. JV414]